MIARREPQQRVARRRGVLGSGLALGLAVAAATAGATTVCEHATPAPHASTRPGHGDIAVFDAGECLIDAATLASRVAPTRIVDVRAQNDALPILPGVIRLRPTEVATSAFLSGDTPLVLIGSAFDALRLLPLCAQLRDSGWADVRVLHGGARAWLAHADVDADTHGAEEIDTAALFELMHSPNAVVLTDDPSKFPVGHGARVMAGDAAAIERLAQAPSTERPALIALVAPGAAADSMRAQLRAAGLPDPVVYSGHAADLDAWAARHARMRAVAGIPPVQDCKWN